MEKQKKKQRRVKLPHLRSVRKEGQELATRKQREQGDNLSLKVHPKRWGVSMTQMRKKFAGLSTDLYHGKRSESLEARRIKKIRNTCRTKQVDDARYRRIKKKEGSHHLTRLELQRGKWILAKSSGGVGRIKESTNEYLWDKNAERGPS